MYFSELGNRIVRKLSDGFVSSFSGSCNQMTQPFQMPLGLTTDNFGNVYVADGAANRVWKVDSGGNATPFAGAGFSGNTGDGNFATATGVALDDPQSIVFDIAGNAFIGSSTVVRVVTPDGIIHTSTGNRTAGNSGDGGIATSAELTGVACLAVNASGRLFIADYPSNVVRIVGPAAPIVVSVSGDGIAPTGDGISSADGRIMCPGTCGGNYVSGMAVILDATASSTDAIYEWAGGGCHRGNSACTVFPQTIAATAVRGYFTTWYIRTFVGGTVGPSFDGPFGITLDASENLYFTETSDCVVRKRTPDGTLTTIAGNGVCGNLGDGIAATDAELNDPQGVVVDSIGNVYIQDTGNGVIRKVTSEGMLHTFVSGVYAGSNSPALAINSSGDLFILGSANTVVRVTPDGIPHAFATISAAYVNSLEGLASGIQGGLVVYGAFDSQYPAFAYLSEQGAVYLSFYANGFDYVPPSGMVFDHRGVQYLEYGACSFGGAELYVYPGVNLNSIGYAVTSFECGYGNDGGPLDAASLNNAVGLAFDNTGNLYVADYGNNAIRIIYSDAVFTAQFEN